MKTDDLIQEITDLLREPAKPGSLKRVVVWLRQRWCSHAGYLEDMQRRRSDDMVTCPCNKCGKLLVATYGLALPMKWERKPDNKDSAT